MVSIMKFVKAPKVYIYSFLIKKFGYMMGDRKYLKVLYYLKTGKVLNLRNPKGYREKIQWLKIFDRNPLYNLLVDKYLVKDFVAKIIGKEHVIPTIGVWDTPDDVNFDELPNQFVLKCNHNSHIGLCICPDKNSFNFSAAKKELWRGYRDDYYQRSREWAYKDVKRRIIAESFLNDGTSAAGENALTDYKFFCFDGVAKMMYISKDISKDPRTDFFDMNFLHLPIRMQDKNADVIPSKPPLFDEMKIAAERLSNGIPFVRVDFYIANNNYYFGEMTLYPSSGLAEMHPGEWDEIIGSWISLPDPKRHMS